MYTAEEKCEIVVYNKFDTKANNNIHTKMVNKIYIINSKVGEKDGFSIARAIRNSGDLESPIIIVCSKGYKFDLNDLKNTLALSIIEEDDNLINNLYKSIASAHKIIMRNSALTFSSYDEIYRIPYDNIYMIEKNYKDDSVTIYTKDDSINRYITIKSAMNEILEDPRFFKCGRSCIVNMHKVLSYDCVTNTIYFDNGMTTNNVVTREKAKFKERLKIYKG